MAGLMYSLTEVLVAIGNSYWRCVACQMQFSRQASIDEHVKLKHREGSPHINSGSDIVVCSSSSQLPIMQLNGKIVSDCQVNHAGCQVSHTVNFSSCSEPQIVKIDLESCSNFQHCLDSHKRHGDHTIKTTLLTHYPQHSTVNNNEILPNNIGPVLHNLVQIHQESPFDFHKDSDMISSNDKDDSNGNKSLLSSMLCLLERGMEMDDISGVIHNWDSLNTDLFEQQLLNNTSELSPLSSTSNDTGEDVLDTTDELLNKAVASLDVSSGFLQPLARASMLQSTCEENLFEKCLAEDHREKHTVLTDQQKRDVVHNDQQKRDVVHNDQQERNILCKDQEERNVRKAQQERDLRNDQQERDIVSNDLLEYVRAKSDKCLSCLEVDDVNASPETSHNDDEEEEEQDEEEIIQKALEMFKKYFEFSTTKYKTYDVGYEKVGRKLETGASSYVQDSIQKLFFTTSNPDLSTSNTDLTKTQACDAEVNLEAARKQVNCSASSTVGRSVVTDMCSSPLECDSLPPASDLPTRPLPPALELLTGPLPLASDLPTGQLKLSNPETQVLAKMFLTKSLVGPQDPSLVGPQDPSLVGPQDPSLVGPQDPSLVAPRFVIKSSPSPLTCAKSLTLNHSIHSHSPNSFDHGRERHSSSGSKIIDERSVLHTKETLPHSCPRVAEKRPYSSCTLGGKNLKVSENKKICAQNITRNTNESNMNTSCLLLAKLAEKHNALQLQPELQVDSSRHDHSAGVHDGIKQFPEENFSKRYTVTQSFEEIQGKVTARAKETSLTQDSKNSTSTRCESVVSKQCSVCEMRFTTAKALQRHIQTNAPFKEVCRCKVCSRKFHCLHHLNVHIYKFHPVRGKPQCLTCNVRFSTLRILEQHVLKHTQDKHGASVKLLTTPRAPPTSPTKGKAWKCATCGFICLNQAHIVAAHKCQGHSQNKCKKCDKRFPTRSSFNLHMATHRMHECDLCGQHFKTKTSYQHHRQSHGTNQGEDHCQPAKVRVKDKKEQSPTYVCSECAKSYKSKKHLQRHIDVDHRGIKDYQFKCQLCQQQFFLSWQLRDHITWHHRKEKPYHCKYCDKGFVCRPTLIRHQRKDHTGVKPHKCHYCHEAFIDKKNLDTHEVKVHLGVYPLSCVECGKGFIQGSALRSHLSLHSNQRPHQCHICGSCFTKTNHLKRHTKSCLKANVPEPLSLDLQNLPVLQPRPPSGLTQYLLPQVQDHFNVLHFPGTLQEHSS